MARLPLTLLAFCLLTEMAHALPGVQTSQSPAEQCSAAIAAAERGHAIPAQLMAAIGRVESGRRDPETGASSAWPWTINAEGDGSFFENKADAIRAVQGLQARGVRSIDVGCMQVNLQQHPSAFPNLDMAFEPAVNADYAATFLAQLYGRTKDWIKATANYHSGNPDEGDPYAAKVVAVWPEEQRKAGLNPPPSRGPGRVAPLAGATPPFPGRQPPRMFAMVGMPPGMTASGQTDQTGAQPATSPPVRLPGQIMPPATMRSGTPQFGALPGQIMRPQMMRVATAHTGMVSGQPATGPGRGLDSYRATPVSVVMLSRLPARMPFGVMMR